MPSVRRLARTRSRAFLPTSRLHTQAALLSAYRSIGDAVAKEDWLVLEQRAMHALGLSYAAVLEMVAVQQTAEEVVRNVAESRGVVAQWLEQAAQSDEGRQRLQEVLLEVRANADDSSDLPASLERLIAGHTEGVPLLSRLRSESGEAPALRGESEHVALGVGVNALLAWSHARFNLHWRAAGRNRLSMGIAGERLRTDCASAEAALVPLLEDLYSVLLRQDRHRLLGAALAVAAAAQQLAPRLAQSQVAAVDALSRKESSRSELAQRLGSTLVQANTLTRQAVAAWGAALRLLLSPPDADGRLAEVSELVLRPSSLPFSSPAERAQVNPKTLTDGSTVTIEGYVSDVAADRQRDGKLVTKLDLELTNARRVQAVAVFTHLPHLGIAPGCFLIAEGLWARRSGLATNRPALEITRRSLQKAARSDWRNAFVISADDYFSIAPNGLALQWTWMPHERLRGGSAGASELVFRPLIRGRGKYADG